MIKEGDNRELEKREDEMLLIKNEERERERDKLLG